MQFDKEKYKEFLTRHSKDKTEPTDRLERYAITLSGSTSDDDVREQLKAVRAFWNQHANGNARISKVAKWCRDRDAELKTQLGAKLETAAWWRATAAEEADKAQAAVRSLTASLADDYEKIGAVTTANAVAYGNRAGVPAALAVQAARQAGLLVVDEKVQLPDQPPINPVQFADLAQNLRGAQIKTIPELLHPGSGTFSIVERYSCKKNPALRLDQDAIRQQKETAGKAINAANTAKSGALATLGSALGSGVDLDAVALYQLVDLVKDAPATAAKRELVGLGVDESDAKIIAALLDGRQKATQVNRADQVRALLTEGQLQEAENQAGALPDGDDKAELVRQIADKKQILAGLLAEAEAARRVSDEATAEKHLRAAGQISRADADEVLRQLPPAPPGPATATGDEASVKVFWQRGPGHDDSTVYVVARTEGRVPTAPGDGTQVYRGTGTECLDPGAPVARPVQYGVFATAEGRPPSRTAVVGVTSKPPVWDLKAEAGTGTVTLRWQAKPEAKVRATRAVPGSRPAEFPVSGNSVQLRDLPDGVTMVFEVVAVYRGADGAELRSLPATVTATPRGEAKANDTLRVNAVLVGGEIRVRASWKQIDNSAVKVLLSADPQPWPFQAVISAADVERGGTVLSGHVDASGLDRVLEVGLPSGMHYLTPLSEGGSGIVVGLSKPVAIIDPVTDVRADVFADHATIAWRWPRSVQLAEVSWKAPGDDDDAWDSYVISQTEYQSKGGAQVPLGAPAIDVEVRAVIKANGKRHPSAPATVSVAKAAKAVKVPIRYRVAGGPFGGRNKKLTFTADQPCADVAVRLIALPGTFMPTKPDEGVIVYSTTLTLAPGVPAEHKVEISKAIKKPYWVRCFVMSGPGKLIDPPMGDLKET